MVFHFFCNSWIGIWDSRISTGVLNSSKYLTQVSIIISFSQELCFSIAGRNVSSKLRTDLFTAMLRQDAEWFDKTENDISVLCVRLASDVDTVQHVSYSFLKTHFRINWKACHCFTTRFVYMYLFMYLQVMMTTVGVTLQNVTSVLASIVAAIILFNGYQRQIILVLSAITISMIIVSYLSGILFFDHIHVMESMLENSSEVK